MQFFFPNHQLPSRLPVDAKQKIRHQKKYWLGESSKSK